MSGISTIAKKREQDRERQANSFQESKELMLKDGDVAVVSIIPTGDENDTRLDEFLVHGVGPFKSDSGKNYWKNIYCDKSDGEDKVCNLCATNNKSSRRFGFWAYVRDVLHTNQNSGDEKWSVIDLPGGMKKYRQPVNAFRVFSRGFGKGDYLWNQLVEIYNEDQSLNKMLVKITRSGADKETTSYMISASREVSKLPKDVLDSAAKLPSIKDFFRDTYKEEIPLLQDVSVEKATSLTIFSEKSEVITHEIAGEAEEDPAADDDEIKRMFQGL